MLMHVAVPVQTCRKSMTQLSGNAWKKHAQRKQEGDMIRDFWTGDIRERQPCHKCLPGHCANREHAVNKGTATIMTPLRNRIEIPALSKWGSLQPIVQVLTMVLAIHMLLARAELWMVGRDIITAHESDSSDVENPQNGRDARHAAQLARADRRQKDRCRQRRVREWLAAPSTLTHLLLWFSTFGGIIKNRKITR